jgi:signal transduction histidine kinase
MKSPGWIPSSIHMSPSTERDVLLIPTLFLLNSFVFSAWPQLGQIATKPWWLLLVWLYGLAMLVPLAWRDRAPVTVFIIQLVLTVAAWPIMPLYTPVVGIPVALYAVSVHRGRTISLLALLASFVPNWLAAAVAFRVQPTLAAGTIVFIASTVLLVIVAAGAWGGGRVTRSIRRQVQLLEREREATREAEVLATERRRIARELHDIVSHAVTAIVLQAAGAARVADTDFAQVTQALAHIETTAKQAMDELRRLLGVLDASDPDRDPGGIGELRAQPGLATDLTALLSSLRDIGMPLTTHVEGTTHDLDRSVDLAAYRIVKEGLFNVLRHAGKDSNASLRLIWEPHRLLIQIDNDTNHAGAHRGQKPSLGRGLVGLREQAHAVGGWLHAGPHHKNGYRLTATLPRADTARSGSCAPPLVPSSTLRTMDVHVIR